MDMTPFSVNNCLRFLGKFKSDKSHIFQLLIPASLTNLIMKKNKITLIVEKTKSIKIGQESAFLEQVTLSEARVGKTLSLIKSEPMCNLNIKNPKNNVLIILYI